MNISIKTFSDLAEEGKNRPDLKKVYGNYILENNTVMFIAERGLGKTFLAMGLCIAIARGDSYYCGEPLEIRGNTLFINMELGEFIFSKRVANLLSHTHTVNQYEAIAVTCRGSLQSMYSELEKLIKEHKPVLVVIDNLRTAFSNGNNESNKDMTQDINKLNDFRDKFGFALLLVHHTKKGTSNSLTSSDLQSGAGAITDLIDADFFMRRSKLNPNERILKRVKSRNCEEQDGAKLIRLNQETLWFELVEDGVDEAEFILPGVDDNNKELRFKASELKKEGKSITEIARIINVNKSTVSRWFKRAA